MEFEDGGVHALEGGWGRGGGQYCKKLKCEKGRGCTTPSPSSYGSAAHGIH